MNLERLFRPKSVAVFGGKWSDYVVDQCRKLGFPGKIWRVHPTRKGCFRSAGELPDAPDSVFFGINRELTIQEFSALHKRGLGGAVILPGDWKLLLEIHLSSVRIAMVLQIFLTELPYGRIK